MCSSAAPGGTIHFLQSVGLMDNGAERWSEHSDSVH